MTYQRSNNIFNQKELLKRLREKGKTPETVNFVKKLNPAIGDNELNKIFIRPKELPNSYIIPKETPKLQNDINMEMFNKPYTTEEGTVTPSNIIGYKIDTIFDELKQSGDIGIPLSRFKTETLNNGYSAAPGKLNTLEGLQTYTSKDGQEYIRIVKSQPKNAQEWAQSNPVLNALMQYASPSGGKSWQNMSNQERAWGGVETALSTFPGFGVLGKSFAATEKLLASMPRGLRTAIKAVDIVAGNVPEINTTKRLAGLWDELPVSERAWLTTESELSENIAGRQWSKLGQEQQSILNRKIEELSGLYRKSQSGSMNIGKEQPDDIIKLFLDTPDEQIIRPYPEKLVTAISEKTNFDEKYILSADPKTLKNAMSAVNETPIPENILDQRLKEISSQYNNPYPKAVQQGVIQPTGKIGQSAVNETPVQPNKYYRIGDLSFNKKRGILNVTDNPDTALQYADTGKLAGFQKGKGLIQLEGNNLNILDIRSLSQPEIESLLGKKLTKYIEPDGLPSWEALEYDSNIYRTLSNKGYDGIRVSGADYGQHIQIFQESINKVKQVSQTSVISKPPVTPKVTNVTGTGTGGGVPPTKPGGGGGVTPPGGNIPPTTGGANVPPGSPLSRIQSMWGKKPGKKVTEKALKTQEWLNDTTYGFRKMQDRVVKAGVTISPGGKDDIVTALTRAPGAANAGATRATLVLDKMAQIAPNTDINDINTLIHAQHGKEVFAQFPNRKMAGGITSAQEYDQALLELRNKLGATAYAEAEQGAKAIQDFYASELQRMVDAGLIDPTLAQELRTKYPWYNPLNYLDDADKLAAQGKNVKPFNVIASGLKRLTEEGTEKAAIAPINVIGDQAIKNEVRITKNEVDQTIFNLMSKDPSMAGQFKKIKVYPHMGQDVPNTLSFFENGKRQLYEVPEWVYRESNVLNKAIKNPAASVAGALNGISRTAFTTASPPFVIANGLNDMLTAFIREGILPNNTGARILSGLKGITKDELDQIYRLSGGLQARFYGRSGEQIAKQAIRTKGGNKFLKKIATFIPDAGEAIEQAPRKAAFKKELDKTLPKWKTMPVEEVAKTPQAKHAAATAVEATINFSRGGYLIKSANPFIMFLNASMEGTKLPFRTLRDKAGARFRMAGLLAGYAGLQAYNQSYTEYQDVPDYIRYGSIVVMLPSKETNPDGTKKPNYLVVVPRTREWGAFFGTQTYIMERMMAENPTEFGQFARTLAPTLSPISDIPNIALFQEAGEQIANYDYYTNRPVVSQSLQNLPTTEQVNPYTSRTMKELGEATGASPVRMEHALSGVFGGAGRSVLSISDFIINMISPDEPEPEIKTLADRYNELGTQEEKDKFMTRLTASNKNKLKNYLDKQPMEIPIVSAVAERVYPQKGGQLENNQYTLEKSVDILPSYWKSSLTPEQMKSVDTKMWTDKKASDAKIIEQYDLDMIDKDTNAREVYLKNNPDIDATMLLWGKDNRSSINSLEAANKLASEAEKYGIPLELIPAFAKQDDGTERFPSNRNLWDDYFAYDELPGSGGYLGMSQSQFEAGKVPNKYKALWTTYQKLKTDEAKASFKKAHKDVTTDLRKEYRKNHPEFDKWLQEEEGMSPLVESKTDTTKKKTSTSTYRVSNEPSTSRASVSGGFATTGVRSSGGTSKYKFPKLRRINTKMLSMT
jgi:hypothetical protein